MKLSALFSVETTHCNLTKKKFELENWSVVASYSKLATVGAVCIFGG